MFPFAREYEGTTTEFKVDDVVRSLKTGKFYKVTKILSEHFFMHNEATKPKLIKDYVLVSSNWIECPQGGQHQWIDVGFRFTKEVCKHCDTPKQEKQ